MFIIYINMCIFLQCNLSKGFQKAHEGPSSQVARIAAHGRQWLHRGRGAPRQLAQPRRVDEAKIRRPSHHVHQCETCCVSGANHDDELGCQLHQLRADGDNVETNAATIADAGIVKIGGAHQLSALDDAARHVACRPAHNVVAHEEQRRRAASARGQEVATA